MKVGVRELKNRLSYYLDVAKNGEEVTVTDRGKEIAVISPVSHDEVRQRLLQMVREGSASWNGRKPSIPAHPVPGRGKLASDIVLEDRR
ncbi:MAG: type II toxin-antitoxin system prevent-host-death family antitoxin [Chloroflexi bacterium]|nr:type II toxin-antitoxin system prevent-host-death family antitoxin [Chloroflexota bacterium]